MDPKNNNHRVGNILPSAGKLELQVSRTTLTLSSATQTCLHWSTEKTLSNCLKDILGYD